MTRLAHDLIQAPTGMDNTNDPTMFGDRICQNLVNLLADRNGVLRAQVQLSRIALSAFTAKIDGLGWLYSAFSTYSAVNTPSNPTPPQLAVVSNGNLYMYTEGAVAYPPTFSGSLVASGNFIVGRRVRMAMFGAELYAVQDANAFANYRIMGNQTLVNMGLNTPTALSAGDFTLNTPGGGTLKDGVVSYTYTYVDSLGRESSPAIPTSADSINFTANPGKDVIVTVNIPNVSDIQQANLYATQGGGSTYYLIQTLNRPIGGGTATYEDNLTDAQVASDVVMPYFGENDPPLPASLITNHKNRVVLDCTSSPGTIQVSNFGSATQFNSIGIQVDSNGNVLYPDDGVTLLVGTDQADVITGLSSFGSVLWVGKRRGQYLMYGDDQTDFTIRQISSIGCVAPDSVAVANSLMMFLGDDGVYVIDGEFLPTKISKPIESVFLGLMASASGRATMEAAIGWYVGRRYHLAVGAAIYVYDLDSQAWTSLAFGAAAASAVVGVLQPGLPGFALVGRSDSFEVDLLDEITANATVSGIVYRTRCISTDNLPWHMRAEMGYQETRVSRKRVRRARITGGGSLSSGSITLTSDGRTETYSSVATDSVDGWLVAQEFTGAMIGRTMDLTLNLAGTGVTIRDVEVDYIFVG